MSALKGALLLLVALALAGCGGDEPSFEPLEVVQDPVQNLDNVLQLRAAFEGDRGKTRLLVLLSPT